jgi:tripartite-type tricarboxylate transporter receptor subunit TctC
VLAEHSAPRLVVSAIRLCRGFEADNARLTELQQEISRVLLSKEVQDDALTLGTQAGGEPPEEFAAFVRGEIRKWGKVIKDAGIKVE